MDIQPRVRHRWHHGRALLWLLGVSRSPSPARQTPEHAPEGPAFDRRGYSAAKPTEAGGLRIGAAVRNSELAADPLVRERYPLLSQALLTGASGQLRNAATVGGNLLQRTRCLYFQDVDASPATSASPAPAARRASGEHRNLAILGASVPCIATHPSDMAVALVALDADRLHVDPTAPRAARRSTDLHRLPGDEPQRDTVLGHGELITAVELPPPVRRRARATARCATVPRSRSPLASVAAVARRRRTAGCATSGSRSAAWPTCPGAPARPRRHCAGAGERGGLRARPSTPSSAAPSRCADNAYKLPLVRGLVRPHPAELAEVAA